MAFQKGQSGNPGGRPKGVSEVREAAQSHGLAAIKTLVAIMNSKKASGRDRVAAANALLDRGYGKAPQPLDGDGEGGPIKLEVAWQPPEG